MSTYYKYYLEFCKCVEDGAIESSNTSFHFDYYKRLCVCQGLNVELGMRNLDGEEVSNYPVEVYNVSEELIGTASTKQEYIDLWNSDSENQSIGYLSGGTGLFQFVLKMNVGKVAPPWVLGVSGEIEEGIYGIEYGLEYQ